MLRISKVRSSLRRNTRCSAGSAATIAQMHWIAWLRKASPSTAYPHMGQDERGICTFPNGDKVAWFKDPDGNVLSLSQHARAPL